MRVFLLCVILVLVYSFGFELGKIADHYEGLEHLYTTTLFNCADEVVKLKKECKK